MTEEGKYSLDAIQNNPDVEDTLAYKIKALETTSPIAIKIISLNNVSIATKSNHGAYYTRIDNFFTDNNIDTSKVISLTINSWSLVMDIFGVAIAMNPPGLEFISPIEQTIGLVAIRVAYLT